MERVLLLSDGTIFRGKAFGSEKETYGELCFTTAITGYQELLTDPSLMGQMVVMTFPMIGNYGINRYDYEALRPCVSALIVREWCEAPNNFRTEKNLDEYLKKYDIPGLYGIDTRRLTRHIRQHGAMKACLLNDSTDLTEALNRLNSETIAANQIEQASTKAPYEVPGQGKRVVLMDFGMKGSILKSLNTMGYNVTVVPYDYTEKQILELNPHGVLLSNGPGDPLAVPQAIETISRLLGRVPIFGICMGCQLLALASGAKRNKMKHGHRGNYPVKELATGRIYLTSQNHGYVIDEGSLSGTDLNITYRNVNDGSIEGINHRVHPAVGVQFHPESAPGPQDAAAMFQQFDRMMEGR
ncbi:MAG: carbamoyl phosphate synthase small subunit [Eubacteriales bacterium]|nr:carbamoyl phosphate synthase small subunit [Eubacteriales bacterium]